MDYVGTDNNRNDNNAKRKPKICVIGLDSVPYSLIKEMYKDLPNLKRMIDHGYFTTLESCHPPITVPAWMVMMSSQSPGRLGVYGFRHRKGFSYNDGWMATSQSIKEPRLWDYLAKDGKKTCLIGVPPTYPPIQVNGSMVSCFITPKDGQRDFTYPASLGPEIQQLVGNGGYLFDVAFRTENRDEILKKLYEMTEKRFQVIQHMLKKEQWDYFMFVEIGVDRLHHMFWKYYDKNHPKYVSGNKYESAIPDYYKFIDQKIGEILAQVDDDTYVLVVSDHGTASMKGAFCINEWLIKEGYLVLKKYPDSVTDLDKCEVDWEKTTAWGWGGYYARIYLNVKGREPSGKVSMQDFDKIRNELKAKLGGIVGPNSETFDNKVFSPEEIYDECNGAKPDLMVYFDNLFWRSAGTIGHKGMYLSENDTGPDDSVHWMDGILIAYNKSKHISSENSSLGRLSIYDVAPTILDIMGSAVPKDMEGKVSEEICKWAHNNNNSDNS
jgi:predicted AlkP superfamily phosphohydrolase/phosphomutase